MPSRTITLQPAESREVKFTFTPTEARSYQVAVDGLIGSFNVLAPEPTPPEPALIELVIHARDTIRVGQSYQVRATARNVSDSTIEFYWKLGLNGSTFFTGQLELEPGEAYELVRETVSHSTPGSREWWIAAYSDDTEIARETKPFVIYLGG